MPGIVGIVSRGKPSLECEASLRTMLSSMRHEVHYVSGECSVPRLGFFAGWIAHSGSVASAVSGFHDEDDIALAFSGECFKGRGPISSPGNERSWIVEKYKNKGEGFIASLNGLFSGLLIDRRVGKAFLFNDRYGIERVYLHEAKDAIYFASEAKALLRSLPELRSFDERGVAQFIAFGCTLEERSLFHGISQLPAGSRWTFEPRNAPRKDRYFSPEEWAAQPTLSAPRFEEEFSERFPEIVSRYTLANQPIGISLTGGLDTRMIMACRPNTQPPPVCYTFSGVTERTLDARIASRIARECGLQHHLLRIKEDFLSDFAQHVDHTVYITDGCTGVRGAHEIYFNRMARTLAPIRLTGNFGSEVLRSMSTFKPNRIAHGLLSPDFQRSVDTAIAASPLSAPHPVTFAAFREIPWNLFGTLAAGRSQVTFRTPYLDNDLVALAYCAPQSARKSPLPALRFINKADPILGRIATDRGQIGERRGLGWAIRRTFAEITFKLDYLHKEGLPNSLRRFDPLLDLLSSAGILGLHKFLPVRRWFRDELQGYLRDSISSPEIAMSSFWNANFLGQMVDQHISGQRNYVPEINAILTLGAVKRLLLSP